MGTSDKPQSTAEEILASIGEIDKIDVFHNLVLVGIYIRPERTAGGIILTQKTRDEDRWQGNAGIVLKKGPQAFVDDHRTAFGGKTVEPGDCVIFRVSDGLSIDINGVHCRLIEDIHVRGTVASPEIVW